MSDSEGTIQIVLATTALELASAVAAIEAGLLDTPSRRLLLHARTGVMTEIATPLPGTPGAAPLLARFDAVIDLGATIDPMHPHQFSPADEDLPMLARLLRRAWDLGDAPLELILESPQVDPAIALARIFPGALLRVYGDGLMAYGPTRRRLPLMMLQRIASVDLVPLVPGLRSRLLHEARPEHRDIPLAALDAVLAEVDAAAPATPELAPSDRSTALVLGQYLVALGLIDAEEEAELHRQMVRTAADAGMERIVFAPHPAAPPSSPAAVIAAGAACGLDVSIVTAPIGAEVLMRQMRPDLLVSCFSTALATGSALFGIPARAVGTARMIRRLEPFPNSNRIPLVLADRLWSADERPHTALGLQEVLDAVAYGMQPRLLADLEEPVRTTLSLAAAEERELLIPTGRLRRLMLPGAAQRRLPGRSHARRAARAMRAWAESRVARSTL